ncbi:hypothetical protein AB205_0183300 [Aquarana catesbeiana]|uniref:Uncharacterized protein n=1 Tax=Aquarana catesbeiana TaxID=8400 RepID=A0A2G9Q6C8_AQUCT|nr:hypothetical protein AB205_0183300 [Aquarana catesbeiana]
MQFLEDQMKARESLSTLPPPPFHPPFPQPQLRLPRTNLGLSSRKKLRSPAGARMTSARKRLWNRDELRVRVELMFDSNTGCSQVRRTANNLGCSRQIRMPRNTL